MTFVFLLFLMKFLGVNKIERLFAVTVISIIIFYLSFRYFLEAPTVKGIFF
jgi:hypothetical protein